MTTQTLAAAGAFTDVCWHAWESVWLVAWQDGELLRVRGVEQPWPSLDVLLGPDAGAFPRLWSDGAAWWLAYRDGQPGGWRAVLCKDGVEV